MTLITGVICNDGIVVASDSASTDPESYTKQPSENKLVIINHNKMVFGGSGDVGLIQKISASISQSTHQKDIIKLRKELKAKICNELLESNKSFVPHPSSRSQPPLVVSMVAGYVNDNPFLFEFDQNGTDTDYTTLKGFLAIGSGKPWAQAYFRPYLNFTKNIKASKIISYRIISDAITLSSGGLSEPIHIVSIEKNGKITKCDPAEINATKDTCELWREIDRNSLTKALNPPSPTTTAVSAADTVVDIPSIQDENTEETISEIPT